MLEKGNNEASQCEKWEKAEKSEKGKRESKVPSMREEGIIITNSIQ